MLEVFRDLCLSFNFILDSHNTLFLSHLMLIVFPLIVLTYILVLALAGDRAILFNGELEEVLLKLVAHGLLD